MTKKFICFWNSFVCACSSCKFSAKNNDERGHQEMRLSAKLSERMNISYHLLFFTQLGAIYNSSIAEVLSYSLWHAESQDKFKPIH